MNLKVILYFMNMDVYYETEHSGNALIGKESEMCDFRKDKLTS